MLLQTGGALWRGNEGSNTAPWEWLTVQHAASPKGDIRFVLEVGDKESLGALSGVAPSILEANRHLRAALESKGYTITYAEVPDGIHSPASWTRRLPAALVVLLAGHRGK